MLSLVVKLINQVLMFFKVGDLFLKFKLFNKFFNLIYDCVYKKYNMPEIITFKNII